jgi:TRAP transporter TAXI family solute receptor
MKRIMSIVAAAIVLCSLSSCSKGASSASGQAASKKAAYEFVRIGTASLGGNFYNWGNAVAQMVTEKMGIKSSSQATSGSAANCTLVRDGEVEIAISQGNTLYEAVSGTGTFKDQKFDTLRSLGTISFNIFHVLARTDAGIKTIADCKGKRIGMGPVGGGIEISGRKLLAVYGIGPDDFKPIYGTSGEMCEQLKTGQIDAYAYAVAPGTAQITDTLSDPKVKLLPMAVADVDKYVANNPDVCATTIPANTYKNEPNEIYTMGSPAILFADKKMDERFAYSFTKAFYENHDYLMGINSGFAPAIPANALKGLCLPLHAGSEKYLKEIGIVK